MRKKVSLGHSREDERRWGEMPEYEKCREACIFLGGVDPLVTPHDEQRPGVRLAERYVPGKMVGFAYCGMALISLT